MLRPHARDAMAASRGARPHRSDQGLSRSSSSPSSMRRSTSSRLASALASALACARASASNRDLSTYSPFAAARAASWRVTTSADRSAAASTNERRLRLMIPQNRSSSPLSTMLSTGGDAGAASCAAASASTGGDTGSASSRALAVRKGRLDGVEATDGIEATEDADGIEATDDADALKDADACRPRASLDLELGLRLDRCGGSSSSSDRRPLAESVSSSV
eukprot:scaffold440_cov73-Phaeocystis_antarctica.AAC.3